jgi:hypothetical protein
MLSNSEFVILLNQASSTGKDRRPAQHLQEQMSYITNAERAAAYQVRLRLVPFINRFRMTQSCISS